MSFAPARVRGVAAVEFVIAVPVLILLMLGVAELGRAWVQYDTLSYAVRNSARYVSEHAIAGTSGVVDVTPAVAEQARNLAVYGAIAAAGAPVLPDFAPDHVTVSNAGNDNIEVRAQYPYEPMIGEVLPLLGGDNLHFTLQVSVTMRAIS